MADTTMLDAALSYARIGLAVFPLVEKSKRPAVANGFYKATTDEEQIRKWWQKNPYYNIGIACGAVSNMSVIDVDISEEKDKHGDITVKEWEKEHGPFPKTAMGATGNGGFHILYRFDSHPHCSSDRPKDKKGIDVRGDGGYIVAPPSIHPDTGTEYAWKISPLEHEIAQADDNVLSFIAFVQKENDQPSDSRALSVPGSIDDGCRNNTLFKLACSLQAKGLSDSAIMAAVQAENAEKCNPPKSVSEVEKTVKSALSKEKGNAVNPNLIKAEIDRNSEGKPLQTITNAKKVLERDDRLAGRFRFNVISYTKTVTLPLPWDDGEGERPVADWDYIGLASYMERRYGLMNKGKAEDAVTEVSMHNRHNPITEWLDSLVWDGQPRVDTLLPCYLGTDMSDYNVSVMRLFMQGAIARAYHPGTKFDYMLVFIGKQGLGKSMFLRRLCHRSEWFCDNFNTIEGDKASEKLRGMWIVELAEMLATKMKKDDEGAKAFITSTVDTFRPAYGKETQQRPRACVFAGTTNSPSFLTDTTGNRRFLPIECGVFEPAMDLFADDVNEYFDQAWAEALHVYKTEHPRLVLDKRSAAFAMEMQEQYLEDDPRVGIIQQYLDNLVEIDRQKLMPEPENLRVCVQELIEEALPDEQSRQQTRYLVNELHSIMQHKITGWVKYPKNKGKAMTKKYGIQRCYVLEKSIKR